MEELTNQVQKMVAQTQLVARDSQSATEQGNEAILQQLDQVQATSDKSEKTKKTLIWVGVAAVAAFVIYLIASKKNH